MSPGGRLGRLEDKKKHAWLLESEACIRENLFWNTRQGLLTNVRPEDGKQRLDARKGKMDAKEEYLASGK